MDATVERDVSEKLLMLQFIFYVAFAKNDSSSPTHMDMELLRRRVALLLLQHVSQEAVI